MNELTIKFDKLPIWIRHEEASNLIKASELKTLRENRKVRFSTIEGKLCYFLEDLLSHKGVVNLIFHSDINLIQEEEKPVVEEIKSTSRFYFGTIISNLNTTLVGVYDPVFSILNPISGNSVTKQEIEGTIVDIQAYSSTYGPRVRVVMYSSEDENKYLVLQLNIDRFFDSLLADIATEYTMTQINSKPCSISLSKIATKSGFEMRIGTKENEIKVIKTTNFIPQPKKEVILSKCALSLDKLKELSVYKRVLLPKTDNNYIKTLEK